MCDKQKMEHKIRTKIQIFMMLFQTVAKKEASEYNELLSSTMFPTKLSFY